MLVPSDIQKREVLCTIPTSAGLENPPLDWREAVRTSADLGLDRFSMFMTGIGPEERRECYALLRERQRHGRLEIPFVHARHDMRADEYRMFMSEFGTERFNLHPLRKAPLSNGDLPDDLRELIYIENVGKLLESDLAGFAGICLDISHLEITRRVYPDYFPELCALIEKFPIGANHVSAYETDERADGCNDKHYFETLSELDYVYHYPPTYFGKYVAIELTNPLSEQLTVKSLLEKHLGLT